MIEIVPRVLQKLDGSRGVEGLGDEEGAQLFDQLYPFFKLIQYNVRNCEKRKKDNLIIMKHIYL